MSKSVEEVPMFLYRTQGCFDIVIEAADEKEASKAARPAAWGVMENCLYSEDLIVFSPLKIYHTDEIPNKWGDVCPYRHNGMRGDYTCTEWFNHTAVQKLSEVETEIVGLLQSENYPAKVITDVIQALNGKQ